MRLEEVHRYGLPVAGQGDSLPAQSLMRASVSSAANERDFPYSSRIILRTPWLTHEMLNVNQIVADICNASCAGTFNEICCYRFPRQEQAAKFTDFIRISRYHRLDRNCHDGASPQEVALEWMRIYDERQVILAWARSTTGWLQDVVQAYRFARHEGKYSNAAHEDAGKLVAKIDPAVADPMNYAGVLIEWAEREHRDWFWRCCRDHHVL
jgi:hypothetical protein